MPRHRVSVCDVYSNLMTGQENGKYLACIIRCRAAWWRPLAVPSLALYTAMACIDPLSWGCMGVLVLSDLNDEHKLNQNDEHKLNQNQI